MDTPLSRDEIFQVLAGLHQDQDPKVLKEVAYNLSLASTSSSSLEERAARALNRIKASPALPQGVLRSTATKSAHGKLSICPICKMEMKPVKLLEARSAYYCPDHRITVPFPKEA